MERVIIISHQRSGTHLTLDSIRNNFKEFANSKFITLNRKINESEEQIEFLKSFEKENAIIKVHFLPDFQLYTKNGELLNRLHLLFKTTKKVYVYRNGLDVMVSLYEYMKRYDKDIRNLSFKEFLLTYNNFDDTPEKYTRIQFWKYHIQSWNNSIYANDLYRIKYEDWIENYENVLKELEKHFGWTLNHKINDIRLQSYKTKNRKIRKLVNLIRGVKTTSVTARKGTIGDYKNYFDEESFNWFRSENEDIMKELGYDDFIKI